MATEYFAFVVEEDYRAFQILVSTPLPRDYDEEIVVPTASTGLAAM